MSFLDQLCAKYRLSIKKQFHAGHQTPDVYLVSDTSGEECVLKLGETPNTIAEIVKNLNGYRKLEMMGLSRMTPHVRESGVNEGTAFILMEFCGDDVWTQLHQTTNPESVYQKLIDEMTQVYQASVQREHDNDPILQAVSVIMSQYKKHIQPTMDTNHLLLPQLVKASDAIGHVGERYCFASWDFTPRNVCLSPCGVKYIDPNNEVVGIPLIDLGCFAGVVRDVEYLPDADRGYQHIKQLAIETGALLGMREMQSCRIFYLGRLLQSLLSCRFRLVSDPDRAKQFFVQAEKYISFVLD